MQNRHFSTSKLIDYFIITIGFVFLIWRAPFGYCFNDEPFLITLAQRLSQGDLLLSHEWNATQNVGTLILPFYRFFHLFNNNNSGIILFFRYIYCFLWFSTCYTVYIVLSRCYRSSIVVFIYLILFSPLDYMTLSYTSFSLISCLLLCSLLFYYFSIRKFNIIIFSCLFSILSCVLVLSYPFIAIFYAITWLLIIIYLLNDNIKTISFLSRKNLCQFFLLSSSIIIVISIVYFYRFVFRGINLSSVKACFMCITSTRSDGNISPLNAFGNEFLGLISLSRLYSSVLIASILIYIVCKTKKIQHLYYIKLVLFLLAAFCYFRCQFIFSTKVNLEKYGTLNYQMVCIVFLGILAYIFIDCKPRKLFYSFIPISLIYSYCAFLSSNTKMQVVSMSLSVAGVACIIIIILLGEELCSHFKPNALKISAFCLFSLVILFQLSSELHVRFTRNYWDLPLNELNYKIEYGAAKGLKTSFENYTEYTETYKSLSILLKNAKGNDLNNTDDNFFSLYFSPVVYLDAELPLGVFSSWSPSQELKWLESYYSANPQKIPKYIFVHSSDIQIFNQYFNEHDYFLYNNHNYVLYMLK